MISEVLRDNYLTANEKLIMITLITLPHIVGNRSDDPLQRKYIYVRQSTYKELATLTSMSVRTVGQTIRRLEDNRYLFKITINKANYKLNYFYVRGTRFDEAIDASILASLMSSYLKSLAKVVCESNDSLIVEFVPSLKQKKVAMEVCKEFQRVYLEKKIDREIYCPESYKVLTGELGMNEVNRLKSNKVGVLILPYTLIEPYTHNKAVIQRLRSIIVERARSIWRLQTIIITDTEDIRFLIADSVKDKVKKKIDARKYTM